MIIGVIMFNLYKKIILLFLICLLPLCSKEIKIGMSADFSDSISYLGNNMRTGILTYLNTFNKTSEHKFKLITLDDKYNPLIASKNVRKLISDDNVIAFLGNVGTPTANVIIPILNEKKVILFGAYSGGNILREKANNKYVFNYRASYAQESYFIVTNLLKLGLKPNQIALFTQNDTYGDSGYSGALKAFKKYGHDLSKVVHGRYTRGTLNIEIALSKMLDTNETLKAIVIVGVDKPTVKFIKYAKEDFPNVKFFSLSPINSKEVAKKINKYNKDMYTTQVVPLLSSKKIKIVEEYKSKLKNEFPLESPNIISFEGYIIAKLFIESIKNIDLKKLDSKVVYSELNKMKNIDIGLGFSSFFDNVTHQYSSKLWLSTIKNEKLVDVLWDDIYK